MKNRKEVEEIQKKKILHLQAIEWHVAQIIQLEKQEQIFLESEKPQTLDPEKLKKPCRCEM